MSEKEKVKIDWSNLPLGLLGRSIWPFTGPFFAIYAFFWPESFGKWWGVIVQSFRTTSGI